ncbi:MAG: recombinase family protein [Acidobacteriota bacterium]
MRVGIYARVSTRDQQTLPMQLNKMKEYIKNRDWTLTADVEEIGSGAKTRPKREERAWIQILVGSPNRRVFHRSVNEYRAVRHFSLSNQLSSIYRLHRVRSFEGHKYKYEDKRTIGEDIRLRKIRRTISLFGCNRSLILQGRRA